MSPAALAGSEGWPLSMPSSHRGHEAQASAARTVPLARPTFPVGAGWALIQQRAPLSGAVRGQTREKPVIRGRGAAGSLDPEAAAPRAWRSAARRPETGLGPSGQGAHAGAPPPAPGNLPLQGARSPSAWEVPLRRLRGERAGGGGTGGGG